MEFQIETPVLVPDFIVFSFLENFTEKLSFVDDLVLQSVVYCTDFKKLTQEVCWGFLGRHHTSSSKNVGKLRITLEEIK